MFAQTWPGGSVGNYVTPDAMGCEFVSRYQNIRFCFFLHLKKEKKKNAQEVEND